MKKLCHSTEMLISSREEYITLVKDGKFMCGKCGRIAVHKENLCRPILIDNINESVEEVENKDMVENIDKELELKEIVGLEEGIVVEESDSKEHKKHTSHHKHGKHKKIKIIKKEKLIKLIHKEARKEIEHYKEQEHQI